MEMMDISKENNCLSQMSMLIAEYLDRLKIDAGLIFRSLLVLVSGNLPGVTPLPSRLIGMFTIL